MQRSFGLLVVFFLTCIVVAAAVGRNHRHTGLPGAQGSIASALGDSIFNLDPDHARVPNFNEIPADARLVAKQPLTNNAAQHILSVAWSVDGRRILYLLYRRTRPEPDAAWVTDLWGVDLDGSHQALLQANFMPLQPVLFSKPLEAFLDCGQTGLHCRLLDPPLSLDASPSPDGKRVVYRESGNDSSWICVKDVHARRQRNFNDDTCFGDGFFSLPAWSPY